MVRDAVILAHPDFVKPFKLQTDASNGGIGVVLLQQTHTIDWHPVIFISRSLTKTEQNYSTTEKELLAIVWTFLRLHPYLHGSSILVETAHQPLVGLIYKNHLPGRLLRWDLALQEYNFTLTYCKGEHNTIANNLSRTEHIQAT